MPSSETVRQIPVTRPYRIHQSGARIQSWVTERVTLRSLTLGGNFPPRMCFHQLFTRLPNEFHRDDVTRHTYIEKYEYIFYSCIFSCIFHTFTNHRKTGNYTIQHKTIERNHSLVTLATASHVAGYEVTVTVTIHYRVCVSVHTHIM